jgi:flagellar biosynthesis/type III secretory pathway protein FliH
MMPFQPLSEVADFVAGVTASAGPGEGPAAEVEAEAPEATLEDLLAEAREEGRQEVLAQVAAERAQVQLVQRQLVQLLNGVDGVREKLVVELREGLASFVLGAVQQVVGETPEMLAQALETRLRDAGERLVRETEVVVQVAPGDQSLAERLLGERKGWRVEVREELEGGCVIFTPSGRLDASMAAALEGLKEAVDSWREQAGPVEAR